MAKMNRIVAGGALVLALGSPMAMGADARTAPRTGAAALLAAAGAAARVQPAGQPAAPVPMPAMITAFEGKVQYRLGPDQPWQNAQVGAMLSEGADIVTSIRSAVQVRIGVGQVLTIDRASRVSIREAINRAGTEKTTVDLPYGRVKFDVSSATVANDVQIQAPDATLAVKGTTGLMEVTAGQPTLAMGGPDNTGSIAVTYDQSGTTSEISEDQASDAETPDPAQAGLSDTQLDVGDTSSRSGDETQQVNNSTGGGQSVTLITAGGTSVVRAAPTAPPGARDLTFIQENSANETLELVRRPALGMDVSVLRSGSLLSGSINGNDNFASLALGSNGNNTGIEVFRLESFSGGWRLLGLDLTQAESVFEVRSSAGLGPTLFGLATIGSRFFASTFGGEGQTGDHTIVELTLGSSSLAPRMFLPFDDVGTDAGGITERGTMVLFGVQNAIDGTSGFYRGTVFEIDPRSNYVLRTSAPMVTGTGTVFEGGTTASSLNGGRVVGMAAASGLIFAQVRTEMGTFLVTINMLAAGTTASPTVVRVQPFTGRLPGLASEIRGPAPAPLNLVPGVGVVDPGLSTLFAAMAYGPLAVSSESFREMVRSQIVGTSVDPTNCAQSSVLFTGLPGFLSGRVNQGNGVGLAVNDLRLSLPFNHPCLRPGQLGALPPIIGLDLDGNVFGADLLGNVTPISGPFSFNFVLGAALRSNTANGMREFLVLDLNGSGGGYELRSLSLANPMGGFSTIDTGSVGSIDLFGLGTIGTRVFTGGLPGGIDADFTIYELGVTPGVLEPVAAIPFDFVDFAIAGSNERGSLFFTGDSRDFSMQPGVTGSVFEFDPRNSYMRGISSIVFGPSTIAPGIDLAALFSHDVEVTGSAYVGNRLVLSVEDLDTGQRYFVIINPDAAGTTANPTVVRVTQSMRDVLGLGSETLLTPPTPLNLANPTSTVDTSLGLAANISYGFNTVARVELGDLFRNALVNTSVDPSNCRISSELTSAPTFLSAHVNQRMGFGQSAFDFRQNLSFGHPCGNGTVTNFNNLILYIDELSGDLVARNAAGLEMSVLTGSFGIDLGSDFDGLARLNNGTAQGALLRLEWTSAGPTSWTLLSLDLNAPTTFTPVASASGSVPSFFGLGTIGSRIFANAPFTSGETVMEIHELTLGSPTTDLRGSFPVSDLHIGLAGAPSRGSVFFIAQVPGASGPGLTGFQVFEYDPRTNHLIGVRDISVDANTIITGTFDITNNPVVTGITYLGTSVIIAAVDGAGQRGFIVYNPSATGGPGDPTVVMITQTGRFPRELASENLVNPPGSPSVGAPTSEPDLRTLPAFATMSYSTASVPAMTGMVISHILMTSQGFTACQASMEFGGIPGLVAAHANQMRGVGQALGDFRHNIGFNHPCQVGEANIGFLFIDESASTLRFGSIDTTTFATDPRSITINPRSGPNQEGGLAVTGSPLGARTLFRLESDIVGGGNDFSEIFALDLRSPTSDFVSVAQFSNFGLTGIGAIGTSLFGVGRPDASVAPGVYGINIGAGSLTQLIDAPFIGNAQGRAAMGGSNERGTIFVNALVPEAMGGPSRLGILEFDPRNNYFVDAYTADSTNGTIFIDTGTQNNAAGFTSFDQVRTINGISYNQGLLTVNGTFEVSPGVNTPLQFQVNTFAAQSGGPNPTRRIDGLASNRFGTVAHLPVNPPAPMGLTNPGGAIDMRGLTVLFADLAFSQRAFDTGVVTRMAESAVVASASNPIGCATSPELQASLGPALNARVNQRAGMGRGITDFRNGLPVNHPCRPN